jgi:hypothetical protein
VADRRYHAPLEDICAEYSRYVVNLHLYTSLISYGISDMPLDNGEGPAEQQKKKKAKSTLTLEMDEAGIPVLPDENPKNKPDIEAVIRQFITFYYREF